MLRILLSKDWIACRDEILNRIKDDVSQQRGNRVLLVPELISHDMERRLCSAAGDTASRFAEVLSFPRLATRIAEEMGAAAMPCLDNGGRIVTMAAATRQLHSQLKAYAALETKPEFLKELVDAIDEFKRCCITSKDLFEASKRADGTLSQKLEELSLILDSYDSLCIMSRQDPRDRMTWCLEQLEDNQYAQEHVLYVDGFPDFTRQNLAILEHFICVCPSVTIGLNCDCVDTESLAFEKAADTAMQLIQIAKKSEIPFEIELISGRNGPLQTLCDALFQGNIPDLKDAQGVVIPIRCQSVQEEIQSAASRIMSLVRNGCRYREIAVVCTDIATYENPLRLVFARHGIPIYLSGKESILQKTVISTVLSALEAALGGFEQHTVLRYLKSALSPLDMDICDRVENYIITWGIRGNAFLKDWSYHPDGFGKEWNEESEQQLFAINEAKNVALIPLQNLSLNMESATNLSEQIHALYSFMEEISLSKRLQYFAEMMEESGENREAQILNQLWEILLSALEQMHDALGQTVWDREVFLRLFMLLLSQYDVGTIPPVLDAVTVGQVNAMRCQETKHLLILGATEGALPGYAGSTGVLTNQERVLLRKMGVSLTGGAMEGLQAEFAEIYGVFCGARETVCVSCSGEESSYLYRRIIRMTGKEQVASEVPQFPYLDEREIGTYLAGFGAKELAASLGVDEWYQDACRRLHFEMGNVSPQGIRSLFGERLNLSASQIDCHSECRMAYFLKYGLRAKERREYTIDPAEFGTYVHDVLEHTAKEVMEMGGFVSVSMEETVEIARKYSDAYVTEHFATVTSERIEYLLRRNWHELEIVVQELWHELSVSSFSPQAFELGFGDHGTMPAIKIESEDISAYLRGFVDRVDIWEKGDLHYFRVVDYKTGKKDFDYCDVFNGVGLQMLLYLFALEENGQPLIGDKPVPAGVQYFPARVPVVTADGRLTDADAEKIRQKEWKRKGLVLDDEEILRAMDPSDDMCRLSCTRKKDSTLSGDIADRNQLKQLRRYVFQFLKSMVAEVASGNIAPNPYTRGTSHNACTYCPYGPICHRTEVTGRRDYKAMTAQKFWEEIEKEVNRHG